MQRLIKLLVVVAIILVIAATSTLFSAHNLHNNEIIDNSEERAFSARHSDYTGFTSSRDSSPGDINYFDFGFDDAHIELIMPDVLPPDSTLVGKLVVTGARPGLEYLLTWYMDNEIILEERVVIGENISTFEHDFEYSRTMAETAIVRATLQYTTRHGEDQEVTVENTVLLQNRCITYWIDLEAERVLETVSSRYEGDRTLEWALENDYDDFDKVVFVNAMEYESDTDYLLWVNRSHQRVNVFEKCPDTETWVLIETFIIATGGWNSMTRRGVTTIPSRTAEGWYFSDPYFFVRPVVRFFPGTGYAFHSRPFSRPGVFRDERIGFPVSAGCIRMYCDDIWYIYNNIPDGTTVVVH
ncbi:MAG: L,D-transpeptidase [Oscillospiraceae bacterium]|nr:L,D-transpeptidase [Oscillospiraceae bacterium]